MYLRQHDKLGLEMPLGLQIILLQTVGSPRHRQNKKVPCFEFSSTNALCAEPHEAQENHPREQCAHLSNNRQKTINTASASRDVLSTNSSSPTTFTSTTHLRLPSVPPMKQAFTSSCAQMLIQLKVNASGKKNSRAAEQTGALHDAPDMIKTMRYTSVHSDDDTRKKTRLNPTYTCG